jgi:5'-phosphate synthase pdxT subunit
MTRIGILALQGDFIEHKQILQQLGVEAVEIRLPHQLDGLDGLVIPGGESTTIGKLAVDYNLIKPIKAMIAAAKPVWGTCAGMILLAKELRKLHQPLIGAMGIVVQRNAFGRQVDSFEAPLVVPALDAVSSPEERGRAFRAVFIRAPLIVSVRKGVEVLAKLDDGTIVAARQGRLLATAFHPELTADTRFHRYFLKLIDKIGSR